MLERTFILMIDQAIWKGDFGMKDKIVLVTGATSGIGRATAQLLAKRGAKVIIGARREKQGEEVIDVINSAGGFAEFMKLDVTDENNVQDVINKIVAKYGKIDFAVNNAGTALYPTPIVNTETESFQKLLQVNVIGVFLCMKYEMQAMLNSGGGAIVNTSSINGLKPGAGSAPYSSTKHAVQAMTQSAALEVADRNIRVNAVAPGPTHSEITAAIDEVHRKVLTDMIPIKRMGNADEIANGIAWLLSDEASFVTGSTLVMDGGLHLKI